MTNCEIKNDGLLTNGCNSYTARATSKTPALVIYVIDTSGSMHCELSNGKTKMDFTNSCLKRMLARFVARSTKGEVISSRYSVALISYSSQVHNLFMEKENVDTHNGIVSIDNWAKVGTPKLSASELTDTASAFLEVERILKEVIPNLPPNSPAPLVCHLTDGMYTGEDPQPIAERIMNIKTNDGSVILENVYIGGELVNDRSTDFKEWTGIVSENQLRDEYAKKLFRNSSPIPRDFVEVMIENGYKKISKDAKLLIPAEVPELIELAFVLSTLTGLKKT